MAITPNTQIRLLSVPFEIDNRNQLTFNNITAQTNYFTSLPNLEVEECSYQRKDNIIKFPAHIDTLLNYNYVMYKNNNYSNKWFYAFIEKMEYENNGTTNIKIKQDVFQTWQFDLIYKKMFVEREHVSSDIIGEHTVPENLDVGEVIEESYEDVYDLADEYYYIILSSYNPATGEEFQGVNKLNGNLFGTYVFAFTTGSVGIVDMRHFIQQTNYDGKIESIEALCIAPKTLIDNIGKTQQTGHYDIATYNFYVVAPTGDQNDNALEIPFVTTRVTSYSDYTPKNKKCFCYPYNYMLVSNNIGSHNIYKYENFKKYNPDYINFALQISFAVGCSGRLVPRDYKNINYNFDESLPLAKYPTCAWSSDAYTNWLTQNAVNIASTIGLGLVGATLGVATGGVGLVATGMSIANTTANLIGQFREANLIPNIQGGQATGDVNFSSKNNGFGIHKMRCKTEYLKIIDDFFTMYGYKVNQVKIPNITGRTNWNYVKTIDANITANIPQEDLQEIKDIFNNGVTFWHNPNTFLDYSQNN